MIYLNVPDAMPVANVQSKVSRIMVTHGAHVAFMVLRKAASAALALRLDVLPLLRRMMLLHRLLYLQLGYKNQFTLLQAGSSA